MARLRHASLATIGISIAPASLDFAKGGCKTNPGYNLVTINDQTENDWLITIMDGYSYTYSDSFAMTSTGIDSDGDGFFGTDDCDDDDDTIFPGAEELPIDGIIQDCFMMPRSDAPPAVGFQPTPHRQQAGA